MELVAKDIHWPNGVAVDQVLNQEKFTLILSVQEVVTHFSYKIRFLVGAFNPMF